MEKTKTKPKTVKSPHGQMWEIPTNIKLPFNGILTSCDNVGAGTRIVSPDKVYALEQVILVLGPLVTEAKVGDWIRINSDSFPRTSKPGKHDTGNVVKVHPPIEEIDGKDYFILNERHIRFYLLK